MRMTKLKIKGFYYKGKHAKGANKHLYCTLNDDNETITAKNLDGENPKHIGQLIFAKGSVENFLKDCEPTSANFTQWQRWIKNKIENPIIPKVNPYIPKIKTTLQKVYTTTEGFLVDDIPAPIYPRKNKSNL